MSYEAVHLSNQIESVVERWYDQLIDLRRDLHRHPELAWHEEQTTARIGQFLQQAGLESIPGPRDRGLIVNVASPDHDQDQWFGIRGDIDAIPVQEPAGLPFTSLNPGVMHACGHDVHATVLAGTLAVTQELAINGELPCPMGVQGIFQPAEEVAQGAKEMIEIGALDGVQAMMAMHIEPMRNSGTIGLKHGVQGAACDQISVTVKGVGGHGARPHEANDPIFAAASWLQEVYCRLPRSVDSRESVVISMCEIKGGSTVNVIPQQVSMRGTLRTLGRKTRDRCFEILDQLSESVGQMTGTEIEIERGASVPFIDNHPQMVQLVANVAESIMGENSIDWIEPSMGSEDFAYYMEHVPSVLIRVGSTPKGGKCSPLHSADLIVDEQIIKVACNLMVRSLIDWWMNR